MADEIEVLGCVATRAPTDTLLRELEQGDASAYGYEVREMARELLAARETIARLTGSAPPPLRPDRCTTHHAACDCREAATRAALDAADALAEAVEVDDGAAQSLAEQASLTVMDAIAAYRAARGAR